MQKQMLARTPVMQLALKEIREDYAAGGARRQMAMGKATTGAAFMGYAYTLALNGTITGAGPSDPERRKFLRETTGWQPFSINRGVDENGRTIWQSYAGLEPIGGMLGMAATVAEIGSVYGADGDDDYQDLLAYTALMPFKYIGELPFMKGMNDFTSMVEEIIRDPKGEQANQSAIKFFGGVSTSMVGGVVPIPMPAGALLRQIENTIDPTKREVTPDPSLTSTERYADFMFRTWLAKTPIGSEKIKPSRNLWGEELTTGENSALYWVMPFNRSVGELDEVEGKLLDIAKARQSMPLKKPEKTIANIRLNDNEYSDLLLMMNNVVIEGQNFKGAIGKALNDPIHRKEMANGAYEGITAKLSNIQSEFKEAAVKNPGFAAEYPDLSAQIQKNQDLAIRKYKQVKREPSLDLED